MRSLLFAALMTVLARGSALAATYTTCVRWQAQTIDSGFGEDRISWANNPNMLVTAYGARIQISQGAWSETFDTSASTGCVTWATTRTGSFNVRVYSYVEDANSNAIRYHNGGDSVFGTYPGSTYSELQTGYLPVANGTTHVDVGGGGAIWTTMATASMMSRYYPGTTSNTQTHVADDVSCGGSSAHHCSGATCLYANGDAYVRLALDTCPSSSDHRRRKFITAHELGHARAILAQEQEEPNANSGLASGGCNDGTSYSMITREWNAIGLREGYAHFVAAWTFNDSTEGDGFMRWFDDTFNIELNSPHLTGGFITSNCGGVTNGQSTNLDVVRTLWDWATPSGSANRASRIDVAETYEATVLSSPAQDEYWDAFYDAAAGEVANGTHDYLLESGCWNGLTDDGC